MNQLVHKVWFNDYNFYSLYNCFKSQLIINIGRKSIYESNEGLNLKDLNLQEILM